MRRGLSFCSFNPVGKIQRQRNLRAAQNLGIAGKEEESVRKMVVEAGVGRVCRLEYESRAVAGGRHLLRFFGRHVGRAEAKGRVLSAIGRTDLFHNEEDFSGPVTFPFLDGIAIGAKDGVTLKIGMYWKEVVIQERELEKK